MKCMKYEKVPEFIKFPHLGSSTVIEICLNRTRMAKKRVNEYFFQFYKFHVVCQQK